MRYDPSATYAPPDAVMHFNMPCMTDVLSICLCLSPLIEPCFAATDLFLLFSFLLGCTQLVSPSFFIFDIYEVWLIWTLKRLLSRDGGKSAFFLLVLLLLSFG